MLAQRVGAARNLTLARLPCIPLLLSQRRLGEAFRAEQINAILNEHETCVATADLRRNDGMSCASFYPWKVKDSLWTRDVLEAGMRLNQVTVCAMDLAASIRFYQALGLRLIVRNEHYARFEAPEGDSTFSLHLSTSGPGENAPVVYFECDHLDAEVARLTALGLTFTSGPVDQPWLWREAQLHDPAGNILILYHAGENRTHPPWRL